MLILINTLNTMSSSILINSNQTSNLSNTAHYYYLAAKSRITTWHYRWHLRLKEETRDSTYMVWYEACKLAALILPSSATSERVFSMSSFLFGDKQYHTLTDILRLSLYLAFNKRDE